MGIGKVGRKWVYEKERVMDSDIGSLISINTCVGCKSGYTKIKLDENRE